MVKAIKRKWLEVALIDILRREEINGEIFSTPGQKKRNPVNKKVGLWIDRHKAVIISIANNIEARRIITSDMEHYIPYSSTVSGEDLHESLPDGRFWNQLAKYYDQIVAHVEEATEIQIFGPEEAKYELKKHLEQQGLAGNIVSMEDAVKMTDLQIATKVQMRFPLRSRFDLSGMNTSAPTGEEKDSPADA